MLTAATALLARCLSISVILVCLVSKLPQIIRVIKTKNVKGISVFSLSLEILRQSILWTYNYCSGYPILTYFDYFLVLMQQSFLFYFVLKCKNSLTTRIILVSIIIFVTIILFMIEVLPKVVLQYVIVLCPAMNIIGRFTQVMQIIRLKNADGISLITWSLTAYVGFARLCAILMTSKNTMLIINSMSALSGSTSILISAFYYQNKAKPKSTNNIDLKDKVKAS